MQAKSRAYLHQPLAYTVAALMMWSTQAFLGLVDLDEFFMITKPNTSVQQLLGSTDCGGYRPWLGCPVQAVKYSASALPWLNHDVQAQNRKD